MRKRTDEKVVALSRDFGEDDDAAGCDEVDNGDGGCGADGNGAHDNSHPHKHTETRRRHTEFTRDDHT